MKNKIVMKWYVEIIQSNDRVIDFLNLLADNNVTPENIKIDSSFSYIRVYYRKNFVDYLFEVPF